MSEKVNLFGLLPVWASGRAVMIKILNYAKDLPTWSL